ncbi:alkaline phosphatase family protein [Hyphococcus formosus]|uniref:hypothetical protein n=1 Tax=Hyphococcus formosus TaxID=3143534 RepID=UPI00398AA841
MPARNLFIGFDGSNPDLIDQMIEEGELPNFKRVREASKIYPIENDPGMGAGQFWSSASIGADPSYHGRYFYIQFNPHTYDIVPNHETKLPDTTPFWNELDAEGFKIAVIDWHRINPKPLNNGILVDNWIGHDPLTPPKFFPPSLAETAAQYFTKDAISGGFESRKRETVEDLQEYLDCAFNRIRTKSKFCTEQIKSGDWDLFVACFSDTHDVGHQFQFLEDRDHELYKAETARHLGNPLRQTYREQDQAIERIINGAGPDARIFMFGGPGMETLISANSALEEMLRRIDLGVGAPVSAAEAARNSYRSFFPLSLRRRIAPLARAIRRNVANSEYQRRRFFSVPHNDNAGAIRINVKGREKFGTVEKGAQYDEVIEEVTSALATFRNLATGRPIVKEVIPVQKLFDGPYCDILPDLFVVWDRTDTKRDFRKIASDQFGEIDVKPAIRNGDHNPYGFFWMPSEGGDQIIKRPGDIANAVTNMVRSPGKVEYKSSSISHHV